MATNIVTFVILLILKSVTSSILNVNAAQTNKIFHGRYTRDINDAELLIPHHVHQDGKFKSFMLPNFYSRDEINARRKRSSFDINEDKLHLILPFNGKEHHIELSPFHDFISPEMVIEIRGEGIGTNLTNSLSFKRAADEQCHYQGFIKDHRNSRAALSLCDGVAGYVLTDDGRYFIEPLDDSQPGTHGQHVHVIYQRHSSDEKEKSTAVCGTSDDWQSAWAEQLIKRERRLMNDSNSDSLKNSDKPSSHTHSIHRYIEVGVVADRKFLDFYRGEDIEKYILTIMNMVSDFYHDATVGNQIDIVVVRIIYLEAEKEEIDLNISTSSEGTLDSFSKWANRINPKDHTHPNHFDIGVLMTRHDICSAKSACGVSGLAYVATACDPTKAAAITEDSGLLLGIIVAHEIGHVVGCSHDDIQISGCPSMDSHDNSYFIMSPYVHIYTLRWSPCSRKFISNLLNTGLGECLNDDPKSPPDKYKYPNMLPGAMYDSNIQCSFKEPGARVCPLGRDALCQRLWCQIREKCVSNGSPPAEGTPCGENRWCIRKQCVSMGSRPNAVHGGWGGWGPTGECSRSCGGGINISERECNNPIPSNGGRYCIGERRRISICNPQPCDPNNPSYRAVQCTEYNSKPVTRDGLHFWIPYFRNDLDQCSLYCINENRAYAKLGVAKDGTSCRGGTKDLCVAGVCQEVGCDWVIGSGAVADKCGVCKGDGTQCTVVEGKYTSQQKFGYAKIITIPKGTMYANFVENRPSKNILAVKDEQSDKYCLNGNFKLQRVGEMNCFGSRLIYNQPKSHQDEIEIIGPVFNDIQIQLLFLHATNPGVLYKYILPQSKSSGYKPKYLWDFVKWSECDVNCGGGTMIATPNCLEEKNGVVSENFCKDLPSPPPKTRICNDHPCPIKWRVSLWSKCSACKGHQGEQTRKVQCVKTSARSNGEDVEVDLQNCQGTPPVQTMKCEGTTPCRPLCHPKPKPTAKRSDQLSMENHSMEDSENIDNLISMGLENYLDETEDDIDGENKNSKDKFKKILQQWALEHENKRMCGGGNYVIEVDTKVTETPPKDSTTEDFKLKTTDAQTEVSTTESGLKLETTVGGLSTISTTEPQQRDNFVTEGNTEIKPLSTLEPGSVIKDEYPANEVVLLEAPIKDDSFKGNLSDIAFQEIGDFVPVQIDTSKEKIFTGPEARERINEMAYGNDTDSDSLDSDDFTEIPAEL